MLFDVYCIICIPCLYHSTNATATEVLKKRGRTGAVEGSSREILTHFETPVEATARQSQGPRQFQLKQPFMKLSFFLYFTKF